MTDLQAWPAWRRAELEASPTNGRVGSILVSETDAVRVWTIALEPGERLPFHRHVLNYFWTATTEGQSVSHYADGRVLASSCKPGDTRHYAFGAGESMTHDLENAGTGTLTYVTVELKVGSANEPLPLAADVPRLGVS